MNTKKFNQKHKSVGFTATFSGWIPACASYPAQRSYIITDASGARIKVGGAAAYYKTLIEIDDAIDDALAAGADRDMVFLQICR